MPVLEIPKLDFPDAAEQSIGIDSVVPQTEKSQNNFQKKYPSDAIDVPVLTANGYLSIKSVWTGISVMNHKGQFNRILDVKQNKTNVVYVLMISGYEPLICDENLLFYVSDLSLYNKRFIPIKDIDINNCLFCSPVSSYSYRDHSFPAVKDDSFLYFKGVNLFRVEKKATVLSLLVEKENTYLINGLTVRDEKKEN